MSVGRERYERARRPEEKAARRAAILQAAARLLDRRALQDVGLNAIAEEAALSKPNIYRYFESREHILLALFIDDLRDFSEDVAPRISRLPPEGATTSQDAAMILVEAYASRPRLCRFLGAIASVFEHNVSPGVVEATKATSLELANAVATALGKALPALRVERCLWINNMAALLVAGLWPLAHPAPSAREVLSRPEFAALRPDFRRDLHEAILTLIRGS